MDFQLTEDQLELQRTIADVLQRESPPDLARGVIEGADDSDERVAALWTTLVGLDWPGLALPEAAGGIGYSWVEQAILCEQLGQACTPGPYLATVTQFAAGVVAAGTDEQVERFVGPVARGETTGALAVDEGAGTWSLEGISAVAIRDGDELVLSGSKRFVADGASADEVVIAVRLDDQLRLVVVPGQALSPTPLEAIDATSPHADLDLEGVRVTADRLLGDGDATDAVARGVEAATLGGALSTLGACRWIFETTVEYAKEREQFDVPIGSFQAVKHKLADMYRDLQRAEALCYFAALCIAEDDPRRTIAGSMAKAAAGDAQARCVKDGLQLHGGIGYTWENDLHLYLRRAKASDLQFGTASHHRQRVARITLAE